MADRFGSFIGDPCVKVEHGGYASAAGGGEVRAYKLKSGSLGRQIAEQILLTRLDAGNRFRLARLLQFSQCLGELSLQCCNRWSVRLAHGRAPDGARNITHAFQRHQHADQGSRVGALRIC